MWTYEKFEYILRNFDNIQPLDKQEFIQFIEYFYDKIKQIDKEKENLEQLIMDIEHELNSERPEYNTSKGV